MTKEEVQQLAGKIASGTATEAEIILYNRMCDFIETTADGSVNIPAAEKAALEDALKKAILQNTGGGRLYRMNRFKWPAVAAVFALLAGIGYFFGRPTGSRPQAYAQQDQRQRFGNEVAPGRQGAVLTLAGGQKIILDSATNGELAREGGARVVKKDGEIVYGVNNAAAEMAWNTMTTPLGRQYQLTLADGTEVWLNAGSSITYPTVFKGSQRTVKITGEAYFEVARNKTMPFRVEKGDVAVEVLGTHFNINAYDDESALKVTLLEGSVSVVSAGDKNTLRPGQQARVANGKMSVTGDVNTEEVMAWKNGRFLFSGMDISQLMRQVSRWYDVDVTYDKEIKDLFYAEIPRNTKLTNVLKALELTGKVHFTVTGKKIIVSP